MDAAGIEEAMTTQIFGNSAAGGMTRAPTQIDVHQGQWAR